MNYTLPSLAVRLARDGEGDIIGLDFEDRDNRPFDRSSDVASGTEMASLIALEAPQARLVPVRLREGDARSIAGVLAFANSVSARIAVMPEWTVTTAVIGELMKAAAARPELLLVIAAGDDGKSLADRKDLAALAALPNVLIVSATDASGKLLAASNHGPPVALLVAASRLKVLTRDGKDREAEGSRFAAARIAALAARLKARAPALEGAALRAKIMGLVKAGVLLNPSDAESAGQ